MRFSLLVLLLTPTLAAAQSAEPGFLMVNQHQCLPDKMPEVRQFSDEVLEPVLQELTDEGLITGWGVLEHAWGDEWNWNFYVVTDTQRSFLDAWGQFAARMSERRPNFYEGGLGQWCPVHRDNMYLIDAMGWRKP